MDLQQRRLGKRNALPTESFIFKRVSPSSPGIRFEIASANTPQPKKRIGHSQSCFELSSSRALYPKKTRNPLHLTMYQQEVPSLMIRGGHILPPTLRRRPLSQPLSPLRHLTRTSSHTYHLAIREALAGTQPQPRRRRAAMAPTWTPALKSTASRQFASEANRCFSALESSPGQ